MINFSAPLIFMISLTRLNKEIMTLNALYIEKLEATPDTLITLTNGKKYLVMEPVEKVIELISSYYKEINVIQNLSIKD